MAPQVRMMTPLPPASQDRIVSFTANSRKREKVPDTVFVFRVGESRKARFRSS
jgi:hypothetical protein